MPAPLGQESPTHHRGVSAPQSDLPQRGIPPQYLGEVRRPPGDRVGPDDGTYRDQPKHLGPRPRALAVVPLGREQWAIRYGGRSSRSPRSPGGAGTDVGGGERLSANSFLHLPYTARNDAGEQLRRAARTAIGPRIATAARSPPLYRISACGTITLLSRTASRLPADAWVRSTGRISHLSLSRGDL
jgi:hypothetical protein